MHTVHLGIWELYSLQEPPSTVVVLLPALVAFFFLALEVDSLARCASLSGMLIPLLLGARSQETVSPNILTDRGPTEG